MPKVLTAAAIAVASAGAAQATYYVNFKGLFTNLVVNKAGVLSSPASFDVTYVLTAGTFDADQKKATYTGETFGVINGVSFYSNDPQPWLIVQTEEGTPIVVGAQAGSTGTGLYYLSIGFPGAYKSIYLPSQSYFLSNCCEGQLFYDAPDPDGTVYDYLNDPVLTHVSITGSAPQLYPVPEPATWAMMLTGFGAIGGAMRMRRKTVTFG